MKILSIFTLIPLLAVMLISTKDSFPSSDILLLTENASSVNTKNFEAEWNEDKEKQFVSGLQKNLDKIFCRLDVPPYQQEVLSQLDKVVFYKDLVDQKVSIDKTIKRGLYNSIIILPEGGEISHVHDSIIISLGKVIVRNGTRRSLVISAGETYIGGSDNIVLSKRRIASSQDWNGKFLSPASLKISYNINNSSAYNTSFITLPNDANISTKQFIATHQISPIFKKDGDNKLFSTGIFSDFICKTKKKFEKNKIDTSCKAVNDNYQLVDADDAKSCELSYQEAKTKIRHSLHINANRPIDFDALKQGYRGPSFYNNGNRLDKELINRVLINYYLIVTRGLSSEANNRKHGLSQLDSYREVIKLLLARMEVLDLDYLARNLYDFLVFDHKTEELIPHLTKVPVVYEENGEWVKYVNKASDFSVVDSIPEVWREDIKIKPLTDYPRNVIDRLDKENDRVKKMVISSSYDNNPDLIMLCAAKPYVEFDPYKEEVNNSFVVGMTRIAHVKRCDYVDSFKVNYKFELHYDNPMKRWKAMLFDIKQENIDIDIISLLF